MILRDLHVHTNYCDGINTPEEMILSAIEKNMECIGFSAHSYTFFDESYCIKKEEIEDYILEINALKEKYKEKICILCGIEQDYYSDMPTDKYDYVIGSVHYLKIGNAYLSIDETKENFVEIAEKYFSNDYYAFAEKYFSTVAEMAEKLHPDIIGHFDLISKFNKDYTLFDETDKRYILSRNTAADRILKLGIPFEINVGGISRGYKLMPYPDIPTILYLAERGGKFIFSGDSHSKDTLCLEFEKWERILKENNIIYNDVCVEF